MTIKTICARDAKKGMLVAKNRENGTNDYRLVQIVKIEYLTYGILLYFDNCQCSINADWAIYDNTDDLRVVWKYSWEEELLINNPLAEKSNGSI